MYITEVLPAYLTGLTTCLSTTNSVSVTEALPDFQTTTAVQDTIGFLGCKGTFPVHVQPLVHQNFHILLSKAGVDLF